VPVHELSRQPARDNGALDLLRQFAEPLECVPQTDRPNDFTAARLRAFDQEESPTFTDKPVYEPVILPGTWAINAAGTAFTPRPVSLRSLKL
jgi:hypothetical protein